jgi:hypothetical protein
MGLLKEAIFDIIHRPSWDQLPLRIEGDVGEAELLTVNITENLKSIKSATAGITAFHLHYSDEGRIAINDHPDMAMPGSHQSYELEPKRTFFQQIEINQLKQGDNHIHFFYVLDKPTWGYQIVDFFIGVNIISHPELEECASMAELNALREQIDINSEMICRMDRLLSRMKTVFLDS